MCNASSVDLVKSTAGAGNMLCKVCCTEPSSVDALIYALLEDTVLLHPYTEQ